MKGMLLKYSTARERSGISQCLILVCSALTIITVQSRRQHFSLPPSQGREHQRDRGINKKEGTRQHVFCVFFLFSEGIDEMGVGGQRLGPC